MTGKPGEGKTSIIQRTMKSLDETGLKAGGIYCPEIRVDSQRVGFEIIDLETKQKGILAHIDQHDGPRVGRYRVNLQDLENIGVEAINWALRSADYIVIDEVGPMELCSKRFREAVFNAVESPKPVLGVIHYRLRNPIISQIKSREDTVIYEVTIENRNNLHNILFEKIMREVERHKL